MLQSLGAIPVGMPLPQIPDALSKGTIEACVIPWEVVPSVKVHELTKFHSEFDSNGPALYTTTFVMAMNKARYDGLAPDLKALLDKASGPYLVELAGTAWDKAIVDGRRTANDAGNKTLTVKPEDYDAMRKASATVEVEWAKEVAPKGLDGAMLVKEVRAIGAKHMK